MTDQKKGKIVLDDSELWEIKKRYEELAKKYAAERSKGDDDKLMRAAKEAAGVEG